MPSARARRRQSSRAQVFVQIGPMNPISPAGNLPILALRRRGVQQPRIPHQRHRDDATILQTYAERVGASTTRSSAADAEKLIPLLAEKPSPEHLLGARRY